MRNFFDFKIVENNDTKYNASFEYIRYNYDELIKSDDDIIDDSTRNCYIKLGLNFNTQTVSPEERSYLSSLDFDLLNKIVSDVRTIPDIMNKESDYLGVFNDFINFKSNVEDLDVKKGLVLNDFEIAKESLSKKVKFKVHNNYISSLQSNMSNDILFSSNDNISFGNNSSFSNKYPGEYSYVNKFKPYKKSAAFDNNKTGVCKIGVYIEKFKNGKVLGRKLVLNNNFIIGSSLSYKQTFFDTKVKYNQNYSYYFYDVFNYTTNEPGDYNILNHYLICSTPQIFNIATTTSIKVNEANALKLRLIGEGLLLNWSMPDNPKNDVIGFHILKRESLTDPYTIIGVCDFGQGFALYNIDNIDTFNEYNIVKSKDKILHFIDKDYDKNKDAIYSLIAYNAHGEISKYSEQVYVSFDQIKNSISTELVSYKGAELDTPNMYVFPKLNSINIKNDIVDVLPETEGKQKITVYCTPDFNNITLLDNQRLTVLKEKYLLSIFKLENQTSFKDLIEIQNFININ